jgi:hypothetical protein
MAQNRNKRIEVLSAKMKYLEETPDEEKINFGGVINYMNGRKYYDEFKEHEFKLIDTDVENCLVGIIITGQNKNIPPKRDRQTGIVSTLDIDVDKESLCYGNIFLYDTILNVFLYEVNISGCYTDKLIDFIQREWTKEEDNITFDLSFPAILRKGEYQRLLDMKHYTEILVELTQPTEILEDYKDDKSTVFSIIKRYLKEGVTTNSDTMTIKLSTHGIRTNIQGLDRKGILQLVDSARHLLKGNQKKNVKTLKVKGYLTDPNEPDTIKPVNLVADTFNTFIKIPVVTKLSNLQEKEKKEEIEKLYKKHLSELKYILNRGNG